jgi:hypothetical protein
VGERSDDLLEPESKPSPKELEDEEQDDDDYEDLSAEESLGLLPPD